MFLLFPTGLVDVFQEVTFTRHLEKCLQIVLEQPWEKHRLPAVPLWNNQAKNIAEGQKEEIYELTVDKAVVSLILDQHCLPPKSSEGKSKKWSEMKQEK